MDKPAGPTSHDVVAHVRRAFGTRRVGHAGTLDPFATGLLAVLVGHATRLARFLTGLSKEYQGTLRLGLRTTTDDLTGEPLGGSGEWDEITDAALGEAMAGLTGRYAQQPPTYSAKKVQGRPAHRRVRRGERVELSPSWVTVDRFALLGRNGSDVCFESKVGSGVYIRALARDLGDRLGCGAHLRELRRTSIGPHTLEQAVTLDLVREGKAVLQPARDAVRHLSAFPLDEEMRTAIQQGRTVPAGQPLPAGTEPVALVAGKDLVAVADVVEGAFQPRVVLAG